MNLATISLAYLRARALNTVLNVVLLALGIAIITLLLLTTAQLEERMGRDARGIDLVAGAKGSPMQVILSAIYHLDVPTGNIPLKEAREIAKHRMVRHTIPLALGDSYRGFRIAGTNHDYVRHYGAQLAGGRLWEKPLEAVLGAEVAGSTGLKAGDKFIGAHGVGDKPGEAHGETPYVVAGVLARSGTVLDRLVLTSVESVWAVHDEHQGMGEKHGAEEEKEITALLIQYATPLAAAVLPRYINNNSTMQAASPAYETARLFSIIGVGVDVLRAFALVLVLSAGLSLFIALYNALAERRYDLAVMRTLGARPTTLMALMLAEGLALAGLGAAAGLGLGHLLTEALATMLRSAQQADITGLTWVAGELWLVALALAVGIASAVLPAWRAYRTDIAHTLAKG